MNITKPANEDADRTRVVELVTCAEASVEALEVKSPGGAWAITAFSRYRVCELLGVTPYGQYQGELAAAPADLMDEAAKIVDRFEVPAEGLSWRLALADALRSAANDIRMVSDARDV